MTMLSADKNSLIPSLCNKLFKHFGWQRVLSLASQHKQHLSKFHAVSKEAEATHTTAPD